MTGVNHKEKSHFFLTLPYHIQHPKKSFSFRFTLTISPWEHGLFSDVPHRPGNHYLLYPCFFFFCEPCAIIGSITWVNMNELFLFKDTLWILIHVFYMSKPEWFQRCIAVGVGSIAIHIMTCVLCPFTLGITIIINACSSCVFQLGTASPVTYAILLWIL